MTRQRCVRFFSVHWGPSSEKVQWFGWSVVEPIEAATFKVPIGKFSGDDRGRERRMEGGYHSWSPLDFGANNCNGPETRNGPLKVVGSIKSSEEAFKFEGS